MKELALTLPGSNGQSIQITPPAGVPSGGLATSGRDIISTSIQILLVTAIVLALFYLIYGGFKWMTSGGEQEKLAGARSTMLYAIIGLCISVLSFLIVNILGHFLGIKDVLNISF